MRFGTTVLAAMVAAACGTGPGTVAVNFSVDDRANRVCRAGDLKWKGSFLFDEQTRLLAFDPTWSGAAPGAPSVSGWPTLYDDGPWTEGGHEPVGARAGDHVWGVTAFVTPPTFGIDGYEYGLIDTLYETTLGNGWIWKGGQVLAQGVTARIRSDDDGAFVPVAIGYALNGNTEITVPARDDDE